MKTIKKQKAISPKRMQKSKLLSMNVNTGGYADFVTAILQKSAAGESDYACVANVHMLVEAHKNPDFARVVNGASIITPDGKPLTWALKLMHGIRQDRVAGMDLLPDLLQEAEKKGLPVFIYGGSEDMLNNTEAYLQQQYPNLVLAGMHSPPFRTLTFKEEDRVVQKISNSGAKLVFVVLGCPKQERWMAAMKGRIPAFMIGIGGALPVLIGHQKRAPLWMQKSGLEWLFRLMQEPGRLARRYAVTNSYFLYLFFSAYLRKKLVRSLS